MNSSRIEWLLRELGADRISLVSGEKEKVRSSCPLALWTHESGRDSHPSFVVFASSEKRSFVKCLAGSCDYKGTLLDLLRTIEWRSKQKLSELINYVATHDQDEILSDDKPTAGGVGWFIVNEDGTKKNFTDPIEYCNSLPCIDEQKTLVEQMQSFLDEESMSYLRNERKVSDETIQKWQLGFHPRARRISIPQYDFSKRLVNISGRYVPSCLDSETYKPVPWLHAKDFKKDKYLFGEDKLELMSEGCNTLFLVEGMFDAIFLNMKGVPNVVAMCGASLGQVQREKIIKWSNHLVVVPDGDEPGYEAARRILVGLGAKIPVSVFNTPLGKDPDNLDDYEIDELKNRFLNT